MNTVTLLGNISTDITSGETRNEKKYARFNLAVKRGRPNKDGEYDADFINCTAWGKVAETIEKFFMKGSPILILGSINTSTYTNKEGENRQMTSVNIAKFYFAGDTGKKKNTSEDPEETKINDDELPF